MKKNILPAILVMVLCSCNNMKFLYSSVNLDWQKKYKTSGCTSSITHLMPSFSKLRINGKFDVDLKDGANYEVVLIGDTALFKYFRFFVKDDVMNIYFTRGARIPKDAIKLKITLPVVSSVTKLGSGEMRAEKISVTKSLFLKQAGSGILYLKCPVEELSAKLSGSGKIIICDTVHSFVKRKISGSGKIILKAL
jgi:hypothetical protein